MSFNHSEKSLTWEHSIPVFSWYIGRGMLIGFSIPTIVILIIALSVDNKSSIFPDIYYSLLLILILFVSTYILLFILFPKGFEYICTIDKHGIKQISGKRVKAVNQGVIIGGLLGRSLSTAGSGLLAYSTEDRYITWKEAKVVKISTKHNYLYVAKAPISVGPIGVFFPANLKTNVVKLVNKYKKVTN